MWFWEFVSGFFIAIRDRKLKCWKHVWEIPLAFSSASHFWPCQERGGALLLKHRPWFQLKGWTRSGRVRTGSEPGSGKPSAWLQGPKAMLGVSPTGLTVWPMTLWSSQCLPECERVIGNCPTWTHWGVRWQVSIIVWVSHHPRKSSTACPWRSRSCAAS